MQNFSNNHGDTFASQHHRGQQDTKAIEHGSHTPLSDEELIPAQHSRNNLFDYAIFFNRGCGHRSAEETQQQDAAFLKRWLTFYRPDLSALPHHDNIVTLEIRRAALNQKHTQLNSPLLAGLMTSVIIATVLSISSSPLLLLIPTGLFLLIWTKTNPDIKENTLHIERNKQLIEQQHALYTHFQNKSIEDFELETLDTFRKNYTLKLERFLHSALRAFTPEFSATDISEQLHSGQLQLYALESRGILQISDLCQQDSNKRLSLKTLAHKTGDGWCATQPYEELRGLTRLHYFYGIICLEHGAIICSAFYDWVGNKMYAEQRDYCAYKHMTHIRHFETCFPEENTLSGELPDELYQLHFGGSVEVISLTTLDGNQHCCNLSTEQPIRQTTLGNLPSTQLTRNLCRDAGRLIANLSQCIQNHSPEGTDSI